MTSATGLPSRGGEPPGLISPLASFPLPRSTEDLVPAVVTVTGGDPKNSKDKPKMYSISQAFHDKYVKNVTPPTWKEHLKTLKQKEHDPPPKKGVAARMRSAPTGKALRLV